MALLLSVLWLAFVLRNFQSKKMSLKAGAKLLYFSRKIGVQQQHNRSFAESYPIS